MLKKSLLSLLLIVSSLPCFGQENLSNEEKEALLLKVEALETKVTSSDESLQKDTISIFLKAIKSDEATFKLFTECRTKVVFEEEKRSDQDARKNQRFLKDAASDEFKRALRHQLYWLTHSIEAKRTPANRDKQAKKLVEGLASIISDTRDLNYEMAFNRPPPGHSLDQSDAKNRTAQINTQKGIIGAISPLYQDPFQSFFAKAFKLEHLKPKDWPKHPMDFNGLYKNVILKSLIKAKDYSSARKQWSDRLKAEAALHKNFGVEPSSKQHSGTPAAYDKFLSISLPSLQWEGEKELFAGGDQKNAASKLFKILEENQDHPKYMAWVKWFKSVLK